MTRLGRESAKPSRRLTAILASFLLTVAGSVAVTTPAQAQDSVVLSNDFESDSYAPWGPRGAVTLTIAPDGRESANSLSVTDRTADWQGAATNASALFAPGVTYAISAWAKLPAGTAGSAGVHFTVEATPADGGGYTMPEALSAATLYVEAEGTTPYLLDDLLITGPDSGPGAPTVELTDVAHAAGVSYEFSARQITNSGWTEVTASFTMPAADSALLYFETRWQNGETGNTSDFLVDDIVVRVPQPPVIEDLTPIYETTDFPVGVAIDSRETLGAPAQLLTRHFHHITAENHMKPEAWYDAERTFRPHDQAIALMDFAQANEIGLYGHVLVWHSQTPAWFFQDEAGEPLGDSAADQQVMRDRLRGHIFAVAGALADGYGPADRTGPGQRQGQPEDHHPVGLGQRRLLLRHHARLML